MNFEEQCIAEMEAARKMRTVVTWNRGEEPVERAVTNEERLARIARARLWLGRYREVSARLHAQGWTDDEVLTDVPGTIFPAID